MRSLEEWTKYLDQQEQALDHALKKGAPVDGPAKIEKEQRPVQAQSPVVHRPPVAPSPKVPVKAEVSAAVRPAAPKPKTDTPTSPANVESVKKAARLRKKLPGRLLSTDGGEQGVARNSYKNFQETREELLNRLLDPQLSLEDTARILNVCPTTVRRYTNKGLLKHLRTAGNQRRFRLSDVLAFMETQTHGETDLP